MKTGRNDPCPCGSGKKYKKCCLAKDQEAAARKPAVPAPPARTEAATQREPAPQRIQAAPPAPRPRSPAAERADVVWETFEEAHGERRAEVFLKALGDAEVMTPDMAFEMLDLLHRDAVANGTRALFATCVNALRERQPETFDHEAHFLLSWLLEDSLAEGMTDRVAPLARELAATAGNDLEIFTRTMDALAFHGQLDAIVPALRIAWPLVKASKDVMAWAVTAFAERGTSYEIYAYIEHNPAPDPADPSLLDRVRFFIAEPRENAVSEMIGNLTGTSVREWKADDFVLQPTRQSDDSDDEDNDKPPARDPAIDNLARLIREFVGYLRREEGVPYPRAQLAREELPRYFLRRHSGDLDPRPSMLEAAKHPGRQLPKPPPPAHPLCPERVTLESHLAGLMDLMSGRYHRAAALFLAMPAWLRFLKSRGLIDDAISKRVVADLIPLHKQLLEFWKRNPEDPLMYRQGQTWLESS